MKKKILFFSFLVLVISVSSVQADRIVLDGVPHYEWWYGCTPTAAGSLMAYWDSQPGFENMYKPGDAQVWWGNGSQGTKRMVASQNYIYGTDDQPDSLAGFLNTNSQGGTPPINIMPGLESFVEWDDSSSYDMKDACQANTNFRDVFGGYAHVSSHYNFLKSEIDSGRPVLMTVQGYNTAHSVLAYGYDDDVTFDLYDVDSGKWVEMPGFAVMDTWTKGSGSNSRWWTWEDHGSGWEMTAVEEIFNGGHEWWPLFPWSNFYMGGDDNHMEWQVSTMYTLEVVPEPTTILLLTLGGLLARRKMS